MTGFGAGILLIPILLHLGVNPRVAAATSGFMLFFIAFASMLVTVIENYVMWEITILYLSLAIIGGFGISKLIYYLI